MCLNIDVRFHKRIVKDLIQPLTAKKDIYCLKLVENYDDNKKTCNSFYREAPQKEGKLMNSKLEVINNLVVEKGLHGIRIFETFISFCTSRETTVMLAKIPKGSKYYIGNDGDIVSNKMILIEPLASNSDDIKGLEVELEGFLSSFKLCSVANKILEDEGYKIPVYK